MRRGEPGQAGRYARFTEMRASGLEVLEASRELDISEATARRYERSRRLALGLHAQPAAHARAVQKRRVPELRWPL